MWLLAATSCTMSTRESGAPSSLSGETGTEFALPVPAFVVPDATGLSLFDRDGLLRWSAPWDGLVGPCGRCGGEGANPDGDGLLVTFTTALTPSPLGGVARLGPDLALDVRVDGFLFPHAAVRDPSDGSVVIAETLEDQLTWIAGDGSSSAALRTLGEAEGLDGLPNGLRRFDHNGATYLLVSHRGASAPGGAPPGTASGSLSLWDITAAPALVWRYPASGALDTPHGPILEAIGDQFWLLYAHTGGGTNGGSVGVALTEDPTVLPRYVADLEVPPALGPLVFLRGVDLDDGELFLVDSGSEQGGTTAGRLLRATFPVLAPTGAVGAVDDDQVFIELTGATVLAEQLPNPFEGWWWSPPAATP